MSILKNKIATAKRATTGGSENAVQVKSTNSNSLQVKKTFKKRGRIILQSALVIVVLGFLVLGSRTNNSSGEPTVARVGEYASVTTLDEVSAADVAATIARDANLLIADNVQNKADSLTALVEFTAAEGAYLDKPQIVATEAKTNQDILEYTTQKNDTIDTIARRFNITSDTIRWANDVSGNIVSEGRKLTIPPISGIIYVVKAGDTAKSVAEKYRANAEQIVAFNDLEIGGLKKNQKLVIPDGRQPEPIAAPVYVAAGPAAVQSTGFSFGSQPLYGGNGYSFGYCTWHVANRRLALGLQMPRNLGNAISWATLGTRAGMSVTGSPSAGAILWHKNSIYLAGGLGHVGFVEGVNADGSVNVSDMNYPIWGTVTTRVIPAAEVSSYLYIN